MRSGDPETHATVGPAGQGSLAGGQGRRDTDGTVYVALFIRHKGIK